MTASSEQTPATPPHTPNRPVLMAGLLGGVLGAVLGFALSRTFPAAPAVPPPPTSEARMFAEDVIKPLRAGKDVEFFAALRPVFPTLTDEQFGKLRDEVLQMRRSFAVLYGALGELEFSRETALSPSLVRLAFVEKYERGCVVGALVLYNSPTGWRVLSFGYQPVEAEFHSGR